MTILKTNTLAGPGGTNAITGAVFFGGDTNTGGLTIADNEDLELGSHTSWTIEFWIKLNRAALSDWDVVMGKGSNQGSGEYEWFVEVMAANHLVFLTTTAGEAWDFNQQITPVLSVGEWYHIAIVRNGSGANTLKSYVNGQEYSSHTSQNIYTGNDAFGIGHFAYTNGLNSDVTLSNVRVVKGTSVYTAAFTPPTSKLTVIPNTVLLCCNDSNDVTQEETGKTITSVGNPVATKDVPSVGTDYGTVFEGDITFDSLNYMTLPKGTTAQRVSSRGRGVIPGGYNPAGSPNAAKSLNTIEYISIQNTANALDFGDLSFGSASGGSCGSSTRGLIGGSYIAPGIVNSLNNIDYITIATTGNGADFGDLTVNRSYLASFSSSTRGIWAGGAGGDPAGMDNTIDYVTIATTGNATDFGDSIDKAYYGAQGASSPTRGIWSGGSPAEDMIQYVTIASTGNSQEFGNLSANRKAPCEASSSTRCVIVGGYTPTVLNTMEYITIATTGNAKDFGDLTFGGAYIAGTSNSVRAVWTGRYTVPAVTNTIEYTEIQTLGNAQDFGDLISAYTNLSGATSDTHGGLA